MSLETLFAELSARLPWCRTEPAAQPHPCLQVPTERWAEALKACRDLGFDVPMDLSCLDEPAQGRIVVVLRVYSMALRQALCLRAALPREAPSIASAVGVWPGCDWHEREAFDLFGVRFEGHPGLKRILLTDDWVGHPLRKDYEDSRMVPRPGA